MGDCYLKEIWLGPKETNLGEGAAWAGGFRGRWELSRVFKEIIGPIAR